MSESMNHLMWYTSRATGVVAVVLMTAILVLGMMVKAGAGTSEQSTVMMGIHRNLSMGMSAFIGLHVVTAIMETYVDIGWMSLLVPFTSGYSTLWIGLGTLAFDAFAAVLVTSLLRERIADHQWRLIHWFSYGLWGFALIHGFALGTSNEPVLRAVSVLCALAGGFAIVKSVQSRDDREDERRRVAAQEWS